MRDQLPQPTDRIALASALEVSPYCLGLVEDPAAVLAAFDAGINFFFVSADMHWPMYRKLREGLDELLARGGGIRDRIVVAAASYVTQPEFCTMPFLELIEELPRLERLDVLVAGGIYGHEFAGRLPVYVRHRERKTQGARALAGSFHDRAAALAQLRAATLDACFIRYNTSHPGARDDIFPYIVELPRGRVLLYNFNCAKGWVTPRQCTALGLHDDVWRPELEDHYRFALSRDEIDGILFKVGDAADIERVVRAVERGPLDEDEQEHMLRLSELRDSSRAPVSTSR